MTAQRGLTAGIIVSATIAVGAMMASGLTTAHGRSVSLGREVLAANDGWAAFSSGTTGGSDAAANQVYVVTTRKELVDALKLAGNSPKIVYLKGTIYGNVDDDNQPLACQDYAAPGYTLAAYLAAYDPSVWGRSQAPSGPLESARKASQTNQQNRVRINLPANTTLVGLGDDARMVGVNLRVSKVDNVIIRNITFEDAYDCFPQWDPTDGSEGNWNSQYDNIWLTGSTHVWVDHCVFGDRGHRDAAQPLYFGRIYQVHDGELDITNGSDLVTVSWNRFTEHDKTMLIGSSDSGSTATGDRGKLRATLHHNVFDRVGQRAPRVRFGQVHVYNNYYAIGADTPYSYSWGVGKESAIYAENNFFAVESGVTPDHFLKAYGGTAIYTGETCVNGASVADRVDLLAVFNAENEPDLVPTVGWAPTLYTPIHPTQAVAGVVRNNAGIIRGAAGSR